MQTSRNLHVWQNEENLRIWRGVWKLWIPATRWHLGYSPLATVRLHQLILCWFNVISFSSLLTYDWQRIHNWSIPYLKPILIHSNFGVDQYFPRTLNETRFRLRQDLKVSITLLIPICYFNEIAPVGHRPTRFICFSKNAKKYIFSSHFLVRFKTEILSYLIVE